MCSKPLYCTTGMCSKPLYCTNGMCSKRQLFRTVCSKLYKIVQLECVQNIFQNCTKVYDWKVFMCSNCVFNIVQNCAAGMCSNCVFKIVQNCTTRMCSKYFPTLCSKLYKTVQLECVQNGNSAFHNLSACTCPLPSHTKPQHLRLETRKKYDAQKYTFYVNTNNS